MAAAVPSGQVLRCGVCGTTIVATAFALAAGGAKLVACPCCSTVVSLPTSDSPQNVPVAQASSRKPAAKQAMPACERSCVLFSCTHALKHAGKVATGAPAGWACGACTYLNYAARATCDVCGALRSATTPSAAPALSPPVRVPLRPEAAAAAAAMARATVTASTSQPFMARAPSSQPLVARASSSSSVLPDGCTATEEADADALYAAISTEAKRTGVKYTDAAFPAGRAALGPTLAAATVRMTLTVDDSPRDCAVPVLWRRLGDCADENGEYYVSARRVVMSDVEAAGLCAPDELAYIRRFIKSKAATNAVPWTLRCGAWVPEDVEQGSLGVCWFVSALVVVCSRSDIMSRLFRHAPQLDALPPAAACDPDAQHVIPLPPHGCVQVRLCIDGLWRCVTIDDIVPVNTVTGGCAYTQCKRRQGWAPLLEKAAAKLCGSYAALTSGTNAEAFRLLTGAHVESIWLRSNETDDEHAARDADGTYVDIDERLLEAVWQRIAGYKAAAYPVGAACSSASVTAAEASRVGLVTDHAYSVTSLHDAGPGRQRLLQLRNPWGGSTRGQWRGDWCDSSSTWAAEPALRDSLGAFMQAESGLFWIALPDFIRYFERMDVACVPEPVAGASCTRVIVPLLQASSGIVHMLHLQPLQDMDVIIEANMQPQGAYEGRSAHVYVRDSSMYDHDVGLAVLCDDAREGVTGMRLVAFAPRRFRQRTTLRVHLRCNSERRSPETPPGGYYVVLLSLNRYFDVKVDNQAFVRPRDNHWAVAALHAQGPLLTELVRRPLSWLARALATCACSTHGKSMLSGGTLQSLGMSVMSLQEGAGSLLVAVNGSPDRTLALTHSFDEMDGVAHSRSVERRTKVTCEDLIPPMTASVCAAVSQCLSRRGTYSFAVSGMAAAAGTRGSAQPRAGGIHAPFALAMVGATR